MKNTEKQQDNIAGAVALIQQSAQDAKQIQVIEVKGYNHQGDEVSVPVAMVPTGDGKVAPVSLLTAHLAGAKAIRELRLLDAAGPKRREGTATLQALRSFVDHANRFKSDNSVIWADAASRRLFSVLDYHPAGPDSAARWGRHRGLYACPLSEAWLAWGGTAGLTLTQEAFAELLDRRDRELTVGNFDSGVQAGKPAPPPADLITLAANLETYSEAKVKKERDPSSQRTKLTFTEEQGVSVGTGPSTSAPPAAFLISIPIFADSEPKTLEVRLRVAVKEQKAEFQIRIQAAGEVLLEAFENLAEYAASETKLPLFIGTPEA